MQSFPKSVFESVFEKVPNDADMCTNVMFAELRDGIVIMNKDTEHNFEDDEETDSVRFERLLQTKYNIKSNKFANITIWRSQLDHGICVFLFTHPPRATLIFNRVISKLASLNRDKLNMWATAHKLKKGKSGSCIKTSHFIFVRGRTTRVDVETTAEFEDVLKQTYTAMSDSDIQSCITHWNNAHNCVVVFQPPLFTTREKRINAAVGASVLGLGAVLYRKSKKHQESKKRRTDAHELDIMERSPIQQFHLLGLPHYSD